MFLLKPRLLPLSVLLYILGGKYTLGKPSSLSKQEILESILKVSTLKKERVENATLWMHDALKQYADENWVDGNQAQICAYMSTKFDETYGNYWSCSTSERNANIYDYVNVDTKEGFIRFELKNGLNFLIFKAPCKGFQESHLPPNLGREGQIT